MTILTLQKRLRQIATVRQGELVTRNGKTYPSTRETWRITTGNLAVAEECAALFGGEAKEWDSKSAERYVVDTTVDRLPIAVIPGHALSQHFELWSGGGCKRRCDGEEELISGQPCMCDPENRECKPHTRLSFVLRGLDQLGLVRLNTTGYYAAVELAGAVEFLERAATKGEVLPGWLRIEERRQIRDGQTKVFKVPVIDVQYGLDRLMPTTTPQIESVPEYKALPAASQQGVSVQDGLAAAARQAEPRARSSRSAEPIGPAGDFTVDAPVPVPGDETVPVDAIPFGEDTKDNGDGSTTTTTVAKATAAQTKKLNVLVGRLLDAGQITREQLYAAMARERQIDADLMIGVIDGARDENGLHWGPLRDTLTKAEATGLIDRLSKLEEKVAA